MASSSNSTTATPTNTKKVIDDLDKILNIPTAVRRPWLFQAEPKPKEEVSKEGEPSKPEAQLTATLITPNARTPNDPYYLIQDYVNFSQPSNFGVKILKVCQISRSTETQDWSYAKVTSTSNRMMLWHGTKPERVRGILEEGLLRPSSQFHQRFGGGIYFADRIAKSSHYCNSRGICEPIEREIGFLFLCEVQLGKIFETKAEALGVGPEGPPFKVEDVLTLKENEEGEKVMTTESTRVPCDSVKYMGALVPDEKGDRAVDGVIWPLGSTVDKTKAGEKETSGGAFGLAWNMANRKDYNEFIVYDEKRIKMKFLVKVEFTKEPVFNSYTV